MKQRVSAVIGVKFNGGDAGREALVRAGVEFKPHPPNAVVQTVLLPEGWTVGRGPEPHAMWSYLYDEAGRERAACFYKSAFYDMRADVDVRSRFRLKNIFQGEENGGVLHERKGALYQIRAIDGKTGEVLVATEFAPFDYTKDHPEYNAVIAFLDRLHPDWRLPGAGWELP